MKNFDYYGMRDETAPKYPSKTDFYTYVVIDIDQVKELERSNNIEHINETFNIKARPINGDKPQSFSNLIVKTEFDEEGFEELTRIYMEESNKRIGEFADDLAEYYDVENKKVAKVIFQAAWERGHSGGLHEVDNYYCQFVEFYEKINEAQADS